MFSTPPDQQMILQETTLFLTSELTRTSSRLSRILLLRRKLTESGTCPQTTTSSEETKRTC